jgi:TRAP-type transport system periplasmic protein
MNKYLVILMALAIISSLIISGCSSSTTPATSAPPPTSAAPAQATTAAPAATTPVEARKIKFSYTMPKGASIGAGFEWFATEFTKRSGGRYTVETYPSETLSKANVALDAVKTNVAEIVGTSTGTFPKDFPLTLVVSIPTLSFPGGVLSSYVEGSDALWELINGVPEVKAEYSSFSLLWSYMLDPYNLVSRKTEIHLPTDFKGLKVGGAGAKMEIVSANGGAKVQMVPPQSYETLDKGVADAAFVTLAQVNDYKLTEICDYFYHQDFGGGNYIIMMNKDFYNSMSAADQKLMMDTWREANVESGKGSMANVEKGAKLINSVGKKVTEPTKEETAAWEKAADVSVAQWKADCKKLNISDEVIDRTLSKWKEVRSKHLANVK